MAIPDDLEKAFEEFHGNLRKLVPDGVIQIDLAALSEMDLLNKEDFDQEEPDEVTEFFHVEETSDKIILHNEKFAIWIVPKMIDEISTTHTYISQRIKDDFNLELVYSTKGVYNTPKFILKVLQKFLIDVLDTEALISSIGKKP